MQLILITSIFKIMTFMNYTSIVIQWEVFKLSNSEYMVNHLCSTLLEQQQHLGLAAVQSDIEK